MIKPKTSKWFDVLFRIPYYLSVLFLTHEADSETKFYFRRWVDKWYFSIKSMKIFYFDFVYHFRAVKILWICFLQYIKFYRSIQNNETIIHVGFTEGFVWRKFRVFGNQFNLFIARDKTIFLLDLLQFDCVKT